MTHVEDKTWKAFDTVKKEIKKYYSDFDLSDSFKAEGGCIYKRMRHYIDGELFSRLVSLFKKFGIHWDKETGDYGAWIPNSDVKTHRNIDASKENQSEDIPWREHHKEQRLAALEARVTALEAR